MKLFFDYFPILCFFIAFKMYGVYVATAVAIAACMLQNLVYYWIHKRFEKLHLITLVIITVLGSFTLIFHRPSFIQWKPTIIYWIFAGVLLGSHYIGEKNMLARMLGGTLSLPKPAWIHLNFAWVIFFTGLGILNLYVMYHYSLNAWVNFKLFGTLGLTLLFVIGQALYLARYLEKQK